MYYDDDAYYDYPEHTAGRWDAWLDDTRLDYRPPHTEHIMLPDAAARWATDVAAGLTVDSLAEWAEIESAYACADCRAYAEDHAAEQAERRAGC